MPKASIYFKTDKTAGKREIKEIKRELDSLPGVISVSVSDSADRVAVDFDTTGTAPGKIGRKPERLGYEILEEKFEKHIM